LERNEANAFTGKLFGNKEMRLLMLGLDAAGKTSQFLRILLLVTLVMFKLLAILYKLKLNQSVTTIPTGACLSGCTFTDKLSIAFSGLQC
jgi:hypothetical protein